MEESQLNLSTIKLLNKHRILIMGVAGSGKTTAGKLLAEKMGFNFIDADNFHPEMNIAKMKNGIALNDKDRESWSRFLFYAIDKVASEGKPMVVACSALKNNMQNSFIEKKFQIFHLHGTKEVVKRRLKNRQGHFFGADLLESQFVNLDIPVNAVLIELDQSVTKIVEDILRKLR